MVSERSTYFLIVALLMSLFCSPRVYGSPYEVLVVDIAKIDDYQKIEGFEEDARQFNALHRMGYLAAKPYFSVLHMANGKVYFVFGFRGEVQGIHRENYPLTVKNLRSLKNGGVQKYPDLHWIPVEKIRELLSAP